MSRMRPFQGALALTIVFAVVALMVVPAGTMRPGNSTGAVSHRSSPGATGPERSTGFVSSHVAPAAPVPGARPAVPVPVGNRVYQTHASAFPGVVQSGRIATDLATGTVYSVSQTSALITAYNGMTGILLRSMLFTDERGNPHGTDIALDNLSHTLYVSVQNGPVAQVDVIDATTFAFVTNITFANSTDPTFAPYRELFDYRTPQLLLENTTNQDVFSVNVATNTLAAFLPVSCAGYQPLGCTSVFGMFFMDSVVGWLAIVPAGSGYCWSIVLGTTAALDVVASGFNGTVPNYLFGPGTYSAFTTDTYFANYSGDGTVVAFNQSGVYIGKVPTGAATPLALLVDPATDVMALSCQNASGAGDLLTGIDPVSGLVVWSTSNSSLPSYESASELAVLDAANGTGYFTTSGTYGSTAELVLLLLSTPYAVVVTTYSSAPSSSSYVAADPAVGLVYELTGGPSDVVAVSEATGAVQWTVKFADTVSLDWLAVDSVGGAVYVATNSGPNGEIWVLAPSTGAYLGALPTTFAPNYDAFGFGHLLYLTDGNNNTIQVYSTAGAPGTLTWSATIQLAANSGPCSLSASPVAEVVADLSCGSLGAIVQISTVAAHTTVKNVSGSPQGFAANFNASGDLYVGNVGAFNTSVQVYTAGTWATGRLLPSPIPVDFVDFVPGLNAVLVSSYPVGASANGPIAVLNASTGAVLGTFRTPGPIGAPAVDPASGTIVATSSAAEMLIANLVATPSAVSGLGAQGGNGTLNVSWSAATAPGGFPVSTYDISTSSASTGPWTGAGSTSTTTFSVTGLTDGTTYYVTVRALGTSGNGPNAAPVSAVPLGVPYPPTGLIASAPTTSSVALSWHTPSVTDGAAVTGYTVLYARSATGPWTAVSGGSGTSATVSSLSAGTTYFFQVEATNSVGTGHPSASASASTSSSSGSGGTLGGAGGSTWWLIGAAIALVLIVIGVAAFLMMRRGRPGRSVSSAPTGPPSGAIGAPEGPPPGAMGGPGSPPPPPPTR
jgi:fibronectin type III domain protein